MADLIKLDPDREGGVLREINQAINEPVYGGIRRSRLRTLTDQEILQVLKEISNILDFRHGKPRYIPKPEVDNG